MLSVDSMWMRAGKVGAKVAIFYTQSTTNLLYRYVELAFSTLLPLRKPVYPKVLSSLFHQFNQGGLVFCAHNPQHQLIQQALNI